MLRTAGSAMKYWKGRTVPATQISVEQCRQAKPRFLSQCGVGPLVYARVPIQNSVCRFYRDSDIRIQLQYDGLGRLARIASDMNPYRSLPVPFTAFALHWAR